MEVPVSSGAYICRLETAGERYTRKMVVGKQEDFDTGSQGLTLGPSSFTILMPILVTPGGIRVGGPARIRLR